MFLVSIIIPTYNAAKFIKETIHSALSQTWSNIEVIVVDDGSTDDSFSILESFKDCRIKLFQQSRKGACAARNLGYKESLGEYVMYLDADDLISPDKISSQLEHIAGKDRYAVASCKWMNFYNHVNDTPFNNKTYFKNYIKPTDMLVDMWAELGMMPNLVWLCSRELLEMAGPWDETLLVNQDGDYFSRVLFHASEICFSPSPMVYYRLGVANSISQSPISRIKAESLLKTYLRYEDLMKDQIDDLKVQRAIANHYYSFIYIYFDYFSDLCKPAINRIEKLKVDPPLNLIGGENFKKLAGIFGFFPVLKVKKSIKRARAIISGEN